MKRFIDDDLEKWKNSSRRKPLILRGVRKISSVDPSGLPLGATASAKIFKALLLDIGLMRSIPRIMPRVAAHERDYSEIVQAECVERGD